MRIRALSVASMTIAGTVICCTLTRPSESYDRQDDGGGGATSPVPTGDPGGDLPAGTATVQSGTGARPTKVMFRSGELDLRMFIYKPAGDGPFPAMIWNHGSEGITNLENPYERLAAFYVENGYAVFFPERHGHGHAAGKPWADYVKAGADRAAQNQRAIEVQEQEVADVLAAVELVKSLPYVDKDRIVMSGCSFGGIQTVLAAERGMGVRAFVPFAPAAMSWAGNPALRQRLLDAIAKAKAPIFLIQAENDYNLGPSKVLGPAVQSSPDNLATVYGAWGTTHAQGHGGFALRGMPVWGKDVLSFLDRAAKR